MRDSLAQPQQIKTAKTHLHSSLLGCFSGYRRFSDWRRIGICLANFDGCRLDSPCLYFHKNQLQQNVDIAHCSKHCLRRYCNCNLGRVSLHSVEYLPVRFHSRGRRSCGSRSDVWCNSFRVNQKTQLGTIPSHCHDSYPTMFCHLRVFPKHRHRSHSNMEPANSLLCSQKHKKQIKHHRTKNRVRGFFCLFAAQKSFF
jgi:hypothetical protein